MSMKMKMELHKKNSACSLSTRLAVQRYKRKRFYGDNPPPPIREKNKKENKEKDRATNIVKQKHEADEVLPRHLYRDSLSKPERHSHLWSPGVLTQRDVPRSQGLEPVHSSMSEEITKYQINYKLGSFGLLRSF